MTGPDRTYCVRVDGFTAVEFTAATPSKARAAAWRAFNEAYPTSFHDFLGISHVAEVVKP